VSIHIRYKPYNRWSYDQNGTHDLLYRVGIAQEELIRACDKLPRTDAQGTSECPFASEWYGDAEEWSDELKDQLVQIQKHRDQALAAASRCTKLKYESMTDDDPRHVDLWKEHEADARKHRKVANQLADKIEEVKATFRTASAIVRERSVLPRQVGL
jgi:hypothetical protein